MKKLPKKIFALFQNSWTAVFIAVLVLMIVSHLVAFIIFSSYSRHTQIEVNRGIVARQIITLVEAVEINPPDKREIIANAINIPNITINFDSYPRYAIQVPTTKIWDILLQLKKIPDSARSLRMSVKFGHKKWLNIAAVVVQSSWNLQIILFVLEFIIILALLFAMWTFNRFNKPLKQFINSIEKIGRGGLDQVVFPENEGPKMMRKAGRALNLTQTRIRDLVRDRTQMLAAISHDLRTPITRLKLRAQFIEDKEQHDKIIHDLSEMEAMISESLAYFKDEDYAYKHVKLDLAALVSSTCIDYEDTGHNVTYSGPKNNLSFEGDSLALKRALCNIIDNAIKYGGNADITLAKVKKNYVITVEDNGPGIPQEELEKVFKPFYRGEQSRNRNTGGIGLGLAAARNIIFAHEGEVTLERKKPHGLIVKIVFPA